MPSIQEEIVAHDPHLSYFGTVNGITVVTDWTTGRRYTWPDLKAWRGESPNGDDSQSEPKSSGKKTLEQLSLFA